MFAPTIEPFDANPRLRSSYTFARDPKDEKKMIFVNRVFFSSYMDFYVYDLLNGMHWGHAPSLCECCYKYFLTTDSHKPKYCDGMAPTESSLHLPPVRGHVPAERKERQPPHLPNLQDPDEHHPQTPRAGQDFRGAAESGHRSVRGIAGQGPLGHRICPGGIPRNGWSRRRYMRRLGGVWEVTVPVTNEELALAFQLGDAGAGGKTTPQCGGLDPTPGKQDVPGMTACWRICCRKAELLPSPPLGKYDAERGYPFYHIRFAKNSGGHGGVSGKGRPAGFHASGPVSPSCSGWASW